MAKKKPVKKNPQDDIPEGLKVLDDNNQRKAAMILAYNGYKRNLKRRSGAVTSAARAAGVDPRSIYRWLDDPIFVNAIEEVTAELITECFMGYRLAIRKGDSKAIEALLAQLCPDLDRALQRQKLAQEHEKEMLRVKAEMGLDANGERPLPTFVFRETAPGERISSRPKSETEH